MKKKPKQWNGPNATWLFPSLLLLIVGCSQKPDKLAESLAYESAVLEAYSGRKDSTAIQSVQQTLRGLDCITAAEYGRRLVLASEYTKEDSNQILVIPFSPNLSNRKSCAYSNVSKRFILLNTAMIKAFTAQYTNDSTDLRSVTAFVLLHEIGHFALGKEGAFDDMKPASSKTGETDFGTTPQYLTANKRVELEADSIGIACVKKHRANTKNMDCYSTASAVEIILPGIQFRLFGDRLLGNFGSPTPNLLKDPSTTHPNMELRVAFMNYYLAGLPQQRQMIDDYLYAREVEPVHRQELDPRIFQGMEKRLN